MAKKQAKEVIISSKLHELKCAQEAWLSHNFGAQTQN